MSQQHTTRASGRGMLERVFKLREHGTTARTEVIAGFTTFLTMVYIVLLTANSWRCWHGYQRRLRHDLSDCCIRQYYDGAVC